MFLYYYPVIVLLSEEFKKTLNEEIKQWQVLFANGVLESSKLKFLCKHVYEKYNTLSLPINELVDARRVILCMKEIESNLMDLEHDIENTNDVYNLLSEYKVEILPEDEVRLDMLNETFKKLKIKVIYLLKSTYLV